MIITGAILGVIFTWQIVTYLRTVQDRCVSFPEFLAIRVVIFFDNIYPPSHFHREAFPLISISSDTTGEIQVRTGMVRGAVPVIGRIYKLSGYGFFWKVTGSEMWISMVQSNQPLRV